MATSGQITTSTGDSGSYQYVKWWRTGVNYAKPSSTIRWELWTHNAWNYYSNAIKNYGVNINGNSVYGGNTFSNINSGDHLLASGTGVEITQTSGQAKKFGCYTSGAYYVNDSVGYQNVSGGWDGETLDAIYKTATTNTATGNVIGDKFKVSYTNYGGYTYKLRISIPSVIELDKINYNTSNAEFYLSTTAINKIIEKYPNASSVNLGFAIESYSGNTLIDKGNEVIVYNVTYKLPTISNLSHSNITRTGVTISFDSSSVITLKSKGVQISIDKISYIVDESMDISSSSIQVVNKLQANTKYYYRVLATNNSGTTYSEWSEFTTSGNAPDITSVTPVISVGSTTINYNANYDTNASLDSYTIEYGTTESYGTTLTNNNVITTPQNNTLYYYKITVTDNFNRTSTYTSSFTSGGTAPIVNSQINYVRANKASIKFLPTYDTNAHFSNLTIQYFYEGESEQHTQTFSSEPTDIVLTNLKSNKYYTLKMSLTDNHSRTTLGTLYFKTPSGMRINNMVATEFKLNGHVILGMKLNGHVLYE